MVLAGYGRNLCGLPHLGVDYLTAKGHQVLLEPSEVNFDWAACDRWPRTTSRKCFIVNVSILCGSMYGKRINKVGPPSSGVVVSAQDLGHYSSSSQGGVLS